MSKDSSALAYVAMLVHRKNGKRCLCEKCDALTRVVRLASAHISLKRISAARKQERKTNG